MSYIRAKERDGGEDGKFRNISHWACHPPPMYVTKFLHTHIHPQTPNLTFPLPFIPWVILVRCRSFFVLCPIIISCTCCHFIRSVYRKITRRSVLWPYVSFLSPCRCLYVAQECNYLDYYLKPRERVKGNEFWSISDNGEIILRIIFIVIPAQWTQDEKEEVEDDDREAISRHSIWYSRLLRLTLETEERKDPPALLNSWIVDGKTKRHRRWWNEEKEKQMANRATRITWTADGCNKRIPI